MKKKRLAIKKFHISSIHQSVIKTPKIDTKDKVKNINDIMSKEILQMMDESNLSRILKKIENKIAEDSLNESLDKNLEHANLFKDDNH